MWTVERDPILRSSFVNLTILESAPDFQRFRRRMAHAVQALPRLHQRVRGSGPPALSWPEWVDDESFDLDYHVRHVALPAPGTTEQLLEFCAVEAQDNFDLARPLWTIWIVDGIEGGRSALVSKMHHTITDGVGGMRLSMQFVDLSADAPDPDPGPGPGPKSQPTTETPHQTEADGRRGLQQTARQLVGAAAAAAKIANPVTAVETTRSLLRQVAVTESARSPLWTGHRGLARDFQILSFELDNAKRAAKNLGGSLNDLYVTGVTGGVAAYHRFHNADVDDLRMTMAINTRQDRSAGGNSFTPARVLVPAGIEDPRERFTTTRQRLAATRAERSLDLADVLTGLLVAVPPPLLTRLARQQVATVDFATSNLRGAPIDIFVAGARILSNHAFGPTGGTAFNATVLSYKDSMDVGLNCDTAAVTDPGLLKTCIEDGIAEVVKAGL